MLTEHMCGMIISEVGAYSSSATELRIKAGSRLLLNLPFPFKALLGHLVCEAEHVL